jgi:hypothetical protein
MLTYYKISCDNDYTSEAAKTPMFDSSMHIISKDYYWIVLVMARDHQWRNHGSKVEGTKYGEPGIASL